MRATLFILSINLLAACGAAKEEKKEVLSTHQQWLYNLYDGYKKEYETAGNGLVENEIKQKYEDSILGYIKSNGNVLQGIKVYVNSVDGIGAKGVSAEFSDDVSSIKWIQNFERDTAGYELSRGLKTQTSETFDFKYESVTLMDPEYGGGPTLAAFSFYGAPVKKH